MNQGWARQRQRKSNGKGNVTLPAFAGFRQGRQRNFGTKRNAFFAGNRFKKFSETVSLPATFCFAFQETTFFPATSFVLPATRNGYLPETKSDFSGKEDGKTQQISL